MLYAPLCRIVTQKVIQVHGKASSLRDLVWLVDRSNLIQVLWRTGKHRQSRDIVPETGIGPVRFRSTKMGCQRSAIFRIAS